MAVGRKPKPTMLHLVENTINVTKHRSRKKEPKPTGNLTDPPEWLTDRQKVAWTYYMANAPMGLLKKLDRSALTTFVVAEDMHREASQKVAEFGLLTKAPNTGMPIQSPFLPIVNRQAMIMLKAAAELGFTPSSRARVSVDGEEPDENPNDEFFRAG